MAGHSNLTHLTTPTLALWLVTVTSLTLPQPLSFMAGHSNLTHLTTPTLALWMVTVTSPTLPHPP